LTDYNNFNPFLPGIATSTGYPIATEALFYYNAYNTESVCGPDGLECADGIVPWLGTAYAYNDDFTMELRSILDWDIAPKLRTVPGIVEVNSHGGELKTYEISLDSDKLMAYRIPLSRILEALDRNNANAGGAYLERGEQQSLIRGEALISSLNDIESIVIGSSPTGVPVLIRNVAQVRLAPMVRQGFATQDAKGEVVIGVAMMLIGE
jgi:Cu/Ag efflux pump CusA